MESLFFQEKADFQEKKAKLKVIGNVMRNDCCIQVPAYNYSVR